MFRGSVIFDESGFLSEELMNVYGAFAVVSKSFATGTDDNGKAIDTIRSLTFPNNIPNQKYYISSASSTDTRFYQFYKDFAIQQLIGSRDHCVIHADCELAFHPTVKGKTIQPLLSKADVENEMRANPEKGAREYYCQFTSDAGADGIISRGLITRNSETRKPLLTNDTGDKKFIITYDPARQRDNSVILVGEVYGFKQRDIKVRLVNCINLIDINSRNKKKKQPMQTPEQIQYLRELIEIYNAGADSYKNILGVYIDAGAGGGGVSIADSLMQDWTDRHGNVHRGIIDEEFSKDYVKKYPNAVKILHLMPPLQYKSIMYEDLIEMMNQDKIKFTADYDNKGYLSIFDVDEALVTKTTKEVIEKYKGEKLTQEELKIKIDDALSNLESARVKTIELDWQEELALKGIDALKEELVNMVRKKRESKKDSFELCSEKANKLHDDRAYCAALIGYALSCLRRSQNIQKVQKSRKESLASKLPIRKPKFR